MNPVTKGITCGVFALALVACGDADEGNDGDDIVAIDAQGAPPSADARPNADAAASPLDATGSDTADAGSPTNADASAPMIDASDPSEDASAPSEDASAPMVDAVVEPADASWEIPDASQPDAPLPDAAPEIPDAGSAGETDGASSVDAGGPDAGSDNGFIRYDLDLEAEGPRYVTIADFDGDGTAEILVSHLGALTGITVTEAQVSLHRRTGGLADWDKETIVGADAGLRFAGHTTTADLDGDGDLDFVLPSGWLVCTIPIIGSGACGALGWYEQTADGWIRHDIVPFGNDRFFRHVELADLDGDGISDLLTSGEEQALNQPGSAVTMWFKGTNDEARFDPEPRIIGEGGGYSSLFDVDGDGDSDVVTSELFRPDDTSFSWFEQNAAPSDENPTGTWTRHVLNSDTGRAIQMRLVPNLYGDGIVRAVGGNHTNTAGNPPDPYESGIYVFDIPADPTLPWPKTMISTGIRAVAPALFTAPLAPGLFGYGDMDNDGDIDIVVAGDGDPNVYWLEQLSPGMFATHVLQANLPQAGGVTIVDLDGDGANETIITGYEANAVYIFTRSN